MTSWDDRQWIWVLDDDETGDRELFTSKEAAVAWAFDNNEGRPNVDRLVAVNWRLDDLHRDRNSGQYFFADLVDKDGVTIASIWGQEVRS